MGAWPWALELVLWNIDLARGCACQDWWLSGVQVFGGRVRDFRLASVWLLECPHLASWRTCVLDSVATKSMWNCGAAAGRGGAEEAHFSSFVPCVTSAAAMASSCPSKRRRLCKKCKTLIDEQSYKAEASAIIVDSQSKNTLIPTSAQSHRFLRIAIPVYCKRFVPLACSGTFRRKLRVSSRQLWGRGNRSAFRSCGLATEQSPRLWHGRMASRALVVNK